MNKSVVLQLTMDSPASPGTKLGSSANGGLQVGLDDFSVWALTARLQQTPGGTLDVYLQTQDIPNGPWSDIAHFPQLVAGSAVLGYRVVFARGFNPPTTAPAVNSTDNTPTLVANSVLTWANGSSLRLVVVAGAGVVAAATQQITGFVAVE